MPFTRFINNWSSFPLSILFTASPHGTCTRGKCEPECVSQTIHCTPACVNDFRPKCKTCRSTVVPHLLSRVKIMLTEWHTGGEVTERRPWASSWHITRCRGSSGVQGMGLLRGGSGHPPDTWLVRPVACMGWGWSGGPGHSLDISHCRGSSGVHRVRGGSGGHGHPPETSVVGGHLITELILKGNNKEHPNQGGGHGHSHNSARNRMWICIPSISVLSVYNMLTISCLSIFFPNL